MDYLREGIHLRGFAQIDPLVAYQNEAFQLFEDLMRTVWSDFARMIFNVEVQIEGENGSGGAGVPSPPQPYNPGGSSTRPANVSYSSGMNAPAGSAAIAAAAADAGEFAAEELEPLPVVQQRRVASDEQIGRNDPCWCGSGKKFKRCHGA
jgi:preprotein translocase subunit SecA